MKKFKTVPRVFPTMVNPNNAITVLAISGEIISGPVGDADTKHIYTVGFWQEVTYGEDTVLEQCNSERLTVTQADTLAILNPQTQYTAVSALAQTYGYQLLPENQQ